MSNLQWTIAGAILGVLILFIIIYIITKKQTTEVKMKAENPGLWDDVKVELHTLVLTLFYKLKSATFWIAVILIVIGLRTGGMEGMLMAILSALGYTGKEAYQNVKFGQMKNERKVLETVRSPRISENAPIIPDTTNPFASPEKQQIPSPVPKPFDVKEFEEKVTSRALNVYGVENEITKFFAAIDMLGPLPLNPEDYKTSILFEAVAQHGLKAYEEKFGFEYAESELHLKDDKKCEYYSVSNMARQKGIDFWSMLIKVERALANANFPFYNWSGMI